ncbi:MAG TPA: dienelactone hydrolase family protein [Xanthobacteraceae bacterium]|nr:dienelactone hydrolase family protein [Xanthobacteraceae bacterium]
MRARAALAAVTVLVVLAARAAAVAVELPQRVTFASADKHTTLVGYVYKPELAAGARAPAVVMMHGRAGAYSSRANGVYDASTLSRRHQAWGRIWAEQGYIALMVDGFGPRGHPQGFPRYSYQDRPDELNEVTARPLDAYGALAYLRTRPDVIADRVGLIGWSNGASATLAALALDPPGMEHPTPVTGFRAALVFYAGCALKGEFEENGYVPYAPMQVFHGTADKETSAARCAALVERSRELGGDIAITLYDGATHGFDDPSRKRQKNPANAAATFDAVAKAQEFFAKHLEEQ